MYFGDMDPLGGNRLETHLIYGIPIDSDALSTSLLIYSIRPTKESILSKITANKLPTELTDLIVNHWVLAVRPIIIRHVNRNWVLHHFDPVLKPWRRKDLGDDKTCEVITETLKSLERKLNFRILTWNSFFPGPPDLLRTNKLFLSTYHASPSLLKSTLPPCSRELSIFLFHLHRSVQPISSPKSTLWDWGRHYQTTEFFTPFTNTPYVGRGALEYALRLSISRFDEVPESIQDYLPGLDVQAAKEGRKVWGEARLQRFVASLGLQERNELAVWPWRNYLVDHPLIVDVASPFFFVITRMVPTSYRPPWL
ncbi:hypothetical protein M501DRAFT_991709 [Patellaria atrata CBS 101060]|uniref:Uncharacterized protein n=1 Tax=Patellaria atrata CBS 101060 TaxID=1346257 RepID=A0A9P4VNG3_9PEZI|nr:hypothetical protein M501DRAFT_991709 [Patellaria atrata CBS 101060]